MVFAEQVGLPIPAGPVLLAMGALVGMGKYSLTTSLTLAVLAALMSDTIWFELGRRRGHAVLSLLCRISLEPDSCVRRTSDLFTRHRGRFLLISKMVPGLSTAAPPLAGMFGMRLPWFLLWDAGGALVWIVVYGGVGYLFRAQLERVGALAMQMGSGLVYVLGGALAAYIGWKYYERQRFLRELRIARIRPEELMEKLKAGEPIVVVDLRHSVEFEADGVKVQGAFHMLPEEIERRHLEIPRDRDVVLYCT